MRAGEGGGVARDSHHLALFTPMTIRKIIYTSTIVCLHFSTFCMLPVRFRKKYLKAETCSEKNGDAHYDLDVMG